MTQFNQVLVVGSLTMSSVEIAELVGRRHDNVMRDISTALDELGEPSVEYASEYKTNGRTYQSYDLPIAIAASVVVRYSRKAVVQLFKTAFESNEALKSLLQALNDFEIPEDMPDMFVYAIRETESGRIKIGISKHPEKRLQQLQICNGQKLELVTVKRADNRYKDEKAEHLANQPYWLHTEWFDKPESLMGRTSGGIA